MYNETARQQYVRQLDLLEDKEPYATGLAREIIDRESCNGWVNRETYMMGLHLSNDEDLYRQTVARIHRTAGAADAGGAAVVVERWVKDHHAIFFHEPPNRLSHRWALLFADVGSIWRVDWNQVVAHLTD